MHPCLRLRFFLFLTMAFCLPVPGQAQILTWLYPGGAGGSGTFQTGSNWTPNAVPGSMTTVRFLNNTTTTVNFSASATTAAFIEQQGNVTLNLTTSQSYTLTNLNGFTVANAGGQTAYLTISGGGSLHVTNFNSGIATAANSLGIVNVMGSGTSLITDAWNDVGVQGNGQVYVTNGARYQTGGFSSLGYGPGSQGIVRAEGSGSTFTSGQGMAIGNSGSGYVNAFTGGTVNLGANIVMAVNPGSTGGMQIGVAVVNPAGAGTLSSNGLTIGAAGNGIIYLFNGSVANNVGTVNIAASAGSTGELDLGHPSAPGVPGGYWNQSGGSIYVGGTASGAGGNGLIRALDGAVINVTGAGNGIVVRNGHGSIILDGGTINTPTLSGFASDLPTTSTPGLMRGTLNINGGTFLSNDGTSHERFFLTSDAGQVNVNLNGGASFGLSSLWVGGTGGNFFNIQGGSVVNISGIPSQSGVVVGIKGSTTANAILKVDGAGSQLNTSSDEVILLGSSAYGGLIGSGTLQVQNNGTVNANNTLICVGNLSGTTGVLNVNSGGTINSSSVFIGGWDGGPGGTGIVTVGSGGTINVIGTGNGITLYSGLGTLTLDGGTINTPNLTMPDSQINNNTLLRGTININGGTFNHGNKSLLLFASSDSLNFNLLNGATTSSLYNLFVGNAGGTNKLTVQGGSHLNTAASSAIGYQGSNTNTATVTITGANSNWSMANSSVFVGYGGGGTLNIQNGASLGTFGGTVALGGTGGDEGVVNVSGSSGIVSALGEIGYATGSKGTVNMGSPPGTVLSYWYPSTGLAIGGNFSNAGGTGTLNLNSGSVVNGPTVILWPEGTVNINGGYLQLSNLLTNGGKIQFNAGQVTFQGDWAADYQQLSAIFGANPTMKTAQLLSTVGNTQLISDLSLDGGTFLTGSITGGYLLHLNTGRFYLTNSNLVVGTGGALGATLNIPTNLMVGVLNQNNTINISADGRVFLSGGTLLTTPDSAGIVNNGQIQLLHPLSQITGGPITNNGLILGSGQISTNLTNAATGTIRVSTGERLAFAGSSNVNSGNINLVGGTVEFFGQLTNSATGAITGRGTLATSTTTPGGLGLVNNGVLLFSSGNTDIYGDVQNNAGARIVTSGAGITTFYDDVVHNGAEIRTNASSRTVFFGNQSGAGNFTGTGTVEYNGDYRPGNSPANVHYEGSVVFNSTAGLFIELGGRLPGSEFDRLTIQGNIDLSGLLNLQLIHGFIPNPGDSFTIIDNQGIASINGIFTGLTEGTLFTSNGTLFQITYQGGDGNDLMITAVPEPGTVILVGISALLTAGYSWKRYRVRRRFLNESVENAMTTTAW